MTKNSAAATPLVSVVIPTYNRRDLLCETLESVFAQTYPNFEVIVVDDGSTDATGEAVNGRFGERVRYVYQENSGDSSARNRGVRLARGKYVALIDSDDLWRPEKLSKMVAFMEEKGFAYAGHKDSLLLPDGAIVADRKPYLIPNADGRVVNPWLEIVEGRYFSMIGSVCTRDAYLASGGFPAESFGLGADTVWHWRMCAVTPVGFLPEALGVYRRHGGQGSSADRSTAEGLAKRIWALELMKKTSPGGARLTAALDKALCDTCLIQASVLREAGRMAEARESAVKARRHARGARAIAECWLWRLGRDTRQPLFRRGGWASAVARALGGSRA